MTGSKYSELCLWAETENTMTSWSVMPTEDFKTLYYVITWYSMLSCDACNLNNRIPVTNVEFTT